MGSLTTFAENKVLNHTLKVSSYVPAVTNYLALFTADPGKVGTLTNEANYIGYTRIVVTFSPATTRTITQNAQVNFPRCTGGMNNLTHWGLLDTANNMMAFGALETARNVSSGYAPRIAFGEVEITLAAGGVATGFGNSILDWLFRGQALAQPNNIYIALCSTLCTDTVPGIELSGSNYGRAQHNIWDLANGGTSQNTGEILYPQATGDWLPAISAALFDAITNGIYMLYLDGLNLTVLNNQVGRWPDGALRLILDPELVGFGDESVIFGDELVIFGGTLTQ